MAFWNKNRELNESMRDITPAPKEIDRMSVERDIEEIGKAKESELIKFIQDLKQKALSREGLYAIYDEMEEDSLIQGALTILSEDICVMDPIRRRRVWVRPIDHSEHAAEVAEEVENFLDQIDIENKVYTYAYNLLKYGEVFLKTYEDEFKKGEMKGRVSELNGLLYEIIPPVDCLALEKYGIDAGIGEQMRNDKEEKTKGYKIYGNNEFIHIINDRKNKRMKQWLKPAEKDEDEKEYKIKIGTSYLESARTSWQIIQLIEQLLLYVRWGRANNFNIVNVEVGASSKTESIRMLRNVKRLFENQDNLNQMTGNYYGNKKPVPTMANVYVATKQGKGEVTVNPVQNGDINIRELVDLDHWMNKLFSALALPKAYLGFDDSNIGGMNNTSLTRQDARYCRTVKAFREPLIAGITDICNHYLAIEGKSEYENMFVIEMTPIVSPDEAERFVDYESRLAIATQLKEFLDSLENVKTDKLIPYILNNLLDLAGILSQDEEIYEKIDMISPDEEQDETDNQETDSPEPEVAKESDVKEE